MYNADLSKAVINLQVVAGHEETHPVIRRMAQMILDGGGYASIGDIMNQINPEEMDQLLELCESEDGEQDVVLGTLILSHSEGVFPQTLDELSRYTGAFRIMVGGMTLVNQGLAKVYLENMSFGEDMAEKVVFYQGD